MPSSEQPVFSCHQNRIFTRAGSPGVQSSRSRLTGRRLRITKAQGSPRLPGSCRCSVCRVDRAQSLWAVALLRQRNPGGRWRITENFKGDGGRRGLSPALGAYQVTWNGSEPWRVQVSTTVVCSQTVCERRGIQNQGPRPEHSSISSLASRTFFSVWG